MRKICLHPIDVIHVTIECHNQQSYAKSETKVLLFDGMRGKSSSPHLSNEYNFLKLFFSLAKKNETKKNALEVNISIKREQQENSLSFGRLNWLCFCCVY